MVFSSVMTSTSLKAPQKDNLSRYAKSFCKIILQKRYDYFVRTFFNRLNSNKMTNTHVIVAPAGVSN